MSEDVPVGQITLVGLFVTALVTAQLTASKLLAFQIPVDLPIAGSSLVLPGAALAYALTFFASDIYAEVYGQRSAQVMVNVAFFLNFVMIALVWSAILAPAAQNSPITPDAFAAVLAPSTNIVIGSLAAYLVSQNWDVLVFHRIREWTGGAHLWFRNIASTATSQFIDTVIFVGLAFFVVPLGLGTATPLPLTAIASLIVGQYLLKLFIALVDTPFVYLAVGLLRSRGHGRPNVRLAD